MTDTALIFVGYQEARRDKKSDFYLRGMDFVVEGAAYLLESARAMGYKVIFVNHLEEE